MGPAADGTASLPGDCNALRGRAAGVTAHCEPKADPKVRPSTNGEERGVSFHRGRSDNRNCARPRAYRGYEQYIYSECRTLD